jgi:hypothetical protein
VEKPSEEYWQALIEGFEGPFAGVFRIFAKRPSNRARPFATGGEIPPILELAWPSETSF